MSKHSKHVRDFDKNTPEYKCGYGRCLVAMNDTCSHNIMPSIADRKEFPNVSWKPFIMGWNAARRESE